MANVTNTTQSAYDRAADADGAMKFTITVVMVYGGAVFGVLILGFFRGLSKNHDDEDKQVNYFLRDIDKTRRQFAKQRDLSAVYQKLEHTDVEWKSRNRDTENALGRGLANMMVLPVMLSRERDDNVNRKSKWPSLKRLRNLRMPRVFSRQKSSQSDICVNTEPQGIQIEEGSLVDSDEKSNDTSPCINVEIKTISENMDESDCGSFQSSFSYLSS